MRSLGDLAGYRRQGLEKEGGGAAFTLRSVTGNAQPAFRLHQPGRMTDKRGVDRLSSRRNKADPMIDAPYGCGAVRASLHRGKARLPAKHPVTFRSAHHAMVLAIPPAAGRQICFVFRRSARSEATNGRPNTASNTMVISVRMLKSYGVAVCHTDPTPSPVVWPGAVSLIQVYKGLPL